MKVTAIRPQQKAGRFNIYLDGEFALGVDEGTLVEARLKVGKELTAEKLAALTQQAEVGRLLEHALNFLGFRPRSEWEVRNNLAQKTRNKDELGHYSQLRRDDPVITEVIRRLQELGYVNDASFVSWWLDQRLRFDPRGKILLTQELFHRGISRDLVEAELAKYSTEDELDWARRVLLKRGSRYRNLDSLAARKKITALLARRGFSWDVIGRALDTAPSGEGD